MKNQLHYLLFLTLTTICAASYGQGINKNWEKDLAGLLTEFKDCKASADSISCYKYFGLTLKTLYQANDFYSEKSDRYMTVEEISTFLNGNEKWKLLGPAYEKGVLANAQQQANSGKAVAAVYVNDEGLGHISYVLPGDVKLSGTWNMEAPNSASFFTANPEESYINKPLSYAFTKSHIIRVLIYARN